MISITFVCHQCCNGTANQPMSLTILQTGVGSISNKTGSVTSTHFTWSLKIANGYGPLVFLCYHKYELRSW